MPVDALRIPSFTTALNPHSNSGLREPLDELVLEKKVPVIGICVGMQMMADSSEEGELPGLSWIPGVVKKFTVDDKFPIPHMGWNLASKKTSILLDELDDEARFYFLHSYYFAPSSEEHPMS